ncbi:probable E3 ubiquitin-protein ligase RHY1A isoform X1 [Phoenix dactylifera]|uniref:Probable E3 ubiquitin-protein ligase RHY1A isoform X1 n=1 Tax=Phoenix dactylifera TaxID=42345 RepID=A0A8B9AF40_PHODC|nr:probable E3 ubiquitin-protein ligase RHY1A isoform X1 [Phoenix dactylifera]
MVIMAGMLPGVECARRRRLRQGGSTDSPSGSRRSSFCLYTTGYEAHIGSTFMQQRSALIKELQDGALGDAAREAKERLDEKLRAQRSLAIKRHHSMGSMGPVKSRGGDEGAAPMILGKAQREVFSSKKSTRKFSWSKLGWKASEQAECAVCLEEFKAGDILINLPCAHRFHWDCAMPWLESSSHCPCCRMTVFP